MNKPDYSAKLAVLIDADNAPADIIDALLEEIAILFDIYASDSEAMSARGYSKRDNGIRAKVWREAAADVRSIKLVSA